MLLDGVLSMKVTDFSFKNHLRDGWKQIIWCYMVGYDWIKI
jgi:hypothetical protein